MLGRVRLSLQVDPNHAVQLRRPVPPRMPRDGEVDGRDITMEDTLSIIEKDTFGADWARFDAPQAVAVLDVPKAVTASIEMEQTIVNMDGVLEAAPLGETADGEDARVSEESDADRGQPEAMEEPAAEQGRAMFGVWAGEQSWLRGFTGSSTTANNHVVLKFEVEVPKEDAGKIVDCVLGFCTKKRS